MRLHIGDAQRLEDQGQDKQCAWVPLSGGYVVGATEARTQPLEVASRITANEWCHQAQTERLESLYVIHRLTTGLGAGSSVAICVIFEHSPAGLLPYFEQLFEQLFALQPLVQVKPPVAEAIHNDNGSACY